MNTISTRLCLYFFILFFCQKITAQTIGDYRSASSGNWDQVVPTTLWERWDGSTWITNAPLPTTADGAVTIKSGNNVIVNIPVTADNIIVETGSILAVNSAGNNLTIVDNDDVPVDLDVHGTLVLGGLNSIVNGGGSPIVEIKGTLTWTSGEIQIPCTITGSGVANLLTNFAKTLNADFINNGIFNWASGTTVGGIFFNGFVFTNNGTVNEMFSSNRGLYAYLPSAFINNGIFNKTTTFVFSNFNVPFTNNGTIQGIGGLNFTDLGGGIINGPGSIITPGTVTAPGILQSTNEIFSQNSRIKIGLFTSTVPGTGHDQLNITSAGATALNGTLEIIDNGSAPLSIYTILTNAGGSFTGSFSNVIKPPVYSDPVYNGTTVTIEKMFALPLTWGEFSARVNNNKQVQLNWSTLEESNTSSFIIEHSLNGANYEAIGTEKAKGNSSSISKYGFIHTQPDLSGTNFYRIKQLDIDGKSSYSAIRTVIFKDNNVVVVKVSPNPVNNILQFNVQANEVSIILTDMNGVILRKWNVQAGPKSVSIQDLPAGIYQLTIFQKNQKIDGQRIIKL